MSHLLFCHLVCIYIHDIETELLGVENLPSGITNDKGRKEGTMREWKEVEVLEIKNKIFCKDFLSPIVL